MWIKSLDNNIHFGRNVWVSMNHITHFTVRQLPSQRDDSPAKYGVDVYLDASQKPIQPRFQMTQDQASVLVYRGTSEECEQFIREKTGLQTAWQWIGYLVAGGVGAMLTLIFS